MSQRTDSKNPPRVEFQVHFQNGYRGRRHLRKGVNSKELEPPDKHLPRLSRLLALAHRWNHLIEEGVIANYSEIARLMGMSRARVTQIMDLLYLAPQIQEEILLLERKGRDGFDVTERAMRQINCIPDWNGQRKLWRRIRDTRL